MTITEFPTDPAAAAARYAAWGWPVLPLHEITSRGCSCGDRSCSSPAKHPRLPRGVHQATTVRGHVEAWWRRWPTANVAIATGAFVVLDVDGPDGARSLQTLQVEQERLPDTPWVSTARGRHLYFLALGLEVGNSAGRLGPGLDIRGRGGYVVAPPSVHATGWRYRWQDLDSGIATLPSWLAECLRPARRASREIDLNLSRVDAYVRAALEGELARIATAAPHTRNDTVVRAAFRLGQLAGAGLVTAEALTEPLFVAACAVGPGEREARATIARGLAAGAKSPRRVRQP
jgi:hypothetical protein